MDNGDFNEKLEEFLRKGLPERLVKGMRKACVIVQDRAKVDCPVDTGRLRGSIAYDVEEESGNVVGYVGSNVEYAPFVENRKHFLQGAVDASKGEIAQCFEGLV